MSVTKEVNKSGDDAFYVKYDIINSNIYVFKIDTPYSHETFINNESKNLIKNYFGYSMELSDQHPSIIELNNIELICRWGSNAGLSKYYGNVVGTTTLTLSGLAVKVT